MSLWLKYNPNIVPSNHFSSVIQSWKYYSHREGSAFESVQQKLRKIEFWSKAISARLISLWNNIQSRRTHSHNTTLWLEIVKKADLQKPVSSFQSAILDSSPSREDVFDVNRSAAANRDVSGSDAEPKTFWTYEKQNTCKSFEI